MNEPNRPIAEFRIGGTITASVWANEVQQDDRTVVRYSVQLQKRYYDKAAQQWKTGWSSPRFDSPAGGNVPAASNTQSWGKESAGWRKQACQRE